jgi:hypothetical protein
MGRKWCKEVLVEVIGNKREAQLLGKGQFMRLGQGDGTENTVGLLDLLTIALRGKSHPNIYALIFFVACNRYAQQSWNI